VPAHGHADFDGSAQRVGSAQESSSRAYSAAVPSVRSNAYVGRPGCMDRPPAAVGRSATAQWCSRGGLECIGQRWRGHAKAAWREEISSSRRRLSTKASAPSSTPRPRLKSSSWSSPWSRSTFSAPVFAGPWFDFGGEGQCARRLCRVNLPTVSPWRRRPHRGRRDTRTRRRNFWRS
jgi:hypothetical protein